MRNPADVLNSLRSKSNDPTYQYQRLYRNLYNPEFYLMAYQNIYANAGNMTPGTDGKTIDGMSMERINGIIATLRNHSYHPNPAKRTYIKKKNGKLRPLGIPSFDDKLVQEIVRMILESIYEPTFSKRSHGFRPNRSCHTALLQVRDKFTAVKWFIEGDIHSFFDTIDHTVMVNILRKRIQDEYFLALMWKFLKAGYLENWVYHKTYSGTPQGSIISPILSNIYLNEFDQYMENYMAKFNQGKMRERNIPYFQIKEKARWLRRKYTPEKWAAMTDEEKSTTLKSIKEYRHQMQKLPSYNQMDPNFKRLQYVRYADDWICGVIGSKEEAERIKADIKAYLESTLKLELSDEKTLITHAHHEARFLGYDITISNSQQTQKCDKKNGAKIRNFNGNVKLYVPKDKWQNKLMEYSALQIQYVDGKEKFKPRERSYLIHNDDLEIINQYNAEIRGIYNYYRIADNVSTLNSFFYVMKFSLYKTYAAKYKTTISKIRKKFGRKKFGIPYQKKDGKAIRYLYDEGFKRDKHFIGSASVDNLPRTIIGNAKTSLVSRLSAAKCEWCGTENTSIEIHHVKKLKDLKGKSNWEVVMIGRNRKTMALCHECHVKLHNGTLD